MPPYWIPLPSHHPISMLWWLFGSLWLWHWSTCEVCCLVPIPYYSDTKAQTDAVPKALLLGPVLVPTRLILLLWAMLGLLRLLLRVLLTITPPDICLPAQPQYLSPMQNLPPHPHSSSNPNMVHATCLACLRPHHLHQFLTHLPHSSLQSMCLNPNHSHKARCRSNPNKQASQLPPSQWWYWQCAGTSAYNFVIQFLRLIKYECFDTHDDGHDFKDQCLPLFQNSSNRSVLALPIYSAPLFWLP